MRAHRVRGFTLVEILIVVVILGILAAIVVPQFTSASQDAIKGALASQLQTINSQIELYRVQHSGNLPSGHVATVEEPGAALGTAGVGTPNWNGWGVMIGTDYLKDEPNNGYTRTTNVTAGTADPPAPVFDGSSPGWVFHTGTGEVLATGYDNVNNWLSNQGTVASPYVAPAF